MNSTQYMSMILVHLSQAQCPLTLRDTSISKVLKVDRVWNYRKEALPPNHRNLSSSKVQRIQITNLMRLSQYKGHHIHQSGVERAVDIHPWNRILVLSSKGPRSDLNRSFTNYQTYLFRKKESKLIQPLKDLSIVEGQQCNICHMSRDWAILFHFSQ